ncbi:MAG TPA: AMP-binding protein, partial [Acidimicrobiia bacterium]|nr:AMP-binding protein [Acidimicrobiia bacterium]
MNLADVLLRAADASPDARALTWAGGSTTYAELADRSARVAGALAADGRRPGDRVGIVCGNTPAFVVAYLGALRAGAVAVPVNPLGTVAEVEAEFAGTGTQVAIVDHVGQPVVGRLVEEGRAHGLTVVDGGGSGWEAFTSAEPAATVDRSGDDPAVLVHTSGTSGPARAAVLTHANLASNIDQMQRHPGMRVEEGDVVLAVLPFFHVFGLNAVLGLGLATGVELV